MNTKYTFTSKFEDKDNKQVIMWCSGESGAEQMRKAMLRMKDVIEVVVSK